MINYKNTMDTPFNINGYHLSPSSVSKYMPNTLGLSKTKENVIWENPRPNTLFIGNTIHYGIEMMKHNNNDLINTIKEVIELRGYANGELSRSHKYKNDNSFDLEICLRSAKWLNDNCLDVHNQRYETEIYGAVIKNHIYSGTADVLHRNKDNSYSLYDFKNYNGTSEYDEQVQFNQLITYSIMANQKGIKIKEVKIFNPIEETIKTRTLTDEYLNDFIDTQLRD
jgi:hypothetical protein